MLSTDLLKLEQIAEMPSRVTQHLNIMRANKEEQILFRPLAPHDSSALLQFFDSLSETTRRFATYPSYDLECAQQFCDDIGQEDVFRMVAINSDKKTIAVFELSFTLDDSDIERYEGHNIELSHTGDVQFAPCVNDEYQNYHVGTQLLELSTALAKRLGKKRMILWGGVLTDNKQAIRFYEKNHFHMFQKTFIAEDGYECYDGILQLL